MRWSFWRLSCRFNGWIEGVAMPEAPRTAPVTPAARLGSWWVPRAAAAPGAGVAAWTHTRPSRLSRTGRSAHRSLLPPCAVIGGTMARPARERGVRSRVALHPRAHAVTDAVELGPQHEISHAPIHTCLAPPGCQRTPPWPRATPQFVDRIGRIRQRTPPWPPVPLRFVDRSVNESGGDSRPLRLR